MGDAGSSQPADTRIEALAALLAQKERLWAVADEADAARAALAAVAAELAELREALKAGVKMSRASQGQVFQISAPETFWNLRDYFDDLARAALSHGATP